MEEGNSETPIKRDYSDLEPANKVQAILGVVFEPITREKALEMSGVDYENADEEVREQVDAVFNSEQIEASDSEGGEKYLLNEEGRSVLEKSIDIKTAHKQITDQAMSILEG